MNRGCGSTPSDPHWPPATGPALRNLPEPACCSQPRRRDPAKAITSENQREVKPPSLHPENTSTPQACCFPVGGTRANGHYEGQGHGTFPHVQTHAAGNSRTGSGSLNRRHSWTGDPHHRQRPDVGGKPARPSPGDAQCQAARSRPSAPGAHTAQQLESVGQADSAPQEAGDAARHPAAPATAPRVTCPMSAWAAGRTGPNTPRRQPGGRLGRSGQSRSP